MIKILSVFKFSASVFVSSWIEKVKANDIQSNLAVKLYEELAGSKPEVKCGDEVTATFRFLDK